jgi:uncharacterized protein YbjT (DUF2867 family)
MIATAIGSTGLTGSVLVRNLVDDPTITKVISVARRSLEIPNPKLEEVLVRDLAELPALESSLRGELYFCCLGTTLEIAGSKENFEKVDHDAVEAFAKIAKTHSARSFTLISAMLANANSMFFYNRVKGRTEIDVKALGLHSLIILRPALLVGSRREFRLSEATASMALVPLSRFLPTRVRKRFIAPVETLAERMLAEGKAAPAGVHVIEAKDI